MGHSWTSVLQHLFPTVLANVRRAVPWRDQSQRYNHRKVKNHLCYGSGFAWTIVFLGVSTFGAAMKPRSWTTASLRMWITSMILIMSLRSSYPSTSWLATSCCSICSSPFSHRSSRKSMKIQTKCGSGKCIGKLISANKTKWLNLMPFPDLSQNMISGPDWLRHLWFWKTSSNFWKLSGNGLVEGRKKTVNKSFSVSNINFTWLLFSGQLHGWDNEYVKIVRKGQHGTIFDWTETTRRGNPWAQNQVAGYQVRQLFYSKWFWIRIFRD